MCWIGPHPVVTADTRLFHCKIISPHLIVQFGTSCNLQEYVYEGRRQPMQTYSTWTWESNNIKMEQDWWSNCRRKKGILHWKRHLIANSSYKTGWTIVKAAENWVNWLTAFWYIALLCLVSWLTYEMVNVNLYPHISECLLTENICLVRCTSV